MAQQARRPLDNRPSTKINITRGGVTGRPARPSVSLMGEYNQADFLQYLDAAKAAARIESDAELARRMGKKQQPISTWRKGVQPSPDLLDLAADALGVPARNLYVLAGHRIPGDDGQISQEIIPVEIRELISLYNDAARTADERETILSHVRIAVGGLRALFGTPQMMRKVTNVRKRVG